MKKKELLISMFEKDIGPLKEQNEKGFGSDVVHSFVFVHKKKITLNVLLYEMEPTHWVIHHDLSREKFSLSRKMVRICERMQRIVADTDISFSLSGDLEAIQKEFFLKTALKGMLQNYVTGRFTIFKELTSQKTDPTVAKSRLQVHDSN